MHEYVHIRYVRIYKYTRMYVNIQDICIPDMSVSYKYTCVRVYQIYACISIYKYMIFIYVYIHVCIYSYKICVPHTHVCTNICKTCAHHIYSYKYMNTFISDTNISDVCTYEYIQKHVLQIY